MVVPSGDEIDTVLTERHAYLRALIKQPRSKRELEDVFDCSRSTLDRALRDLSDVGLAQYEDGAWKPTLLGWCSYQVRVAYQDRLHSLADVSPLVDDLPLDTPIGCAFLIDADVYEADASMPDAVIQTLLDSVEQATEVYVATPVVVTGFADEFYDRVSSGENYSLEMCLPPEVFEQVHAAFPALTEKMMNDSNVQLYQAPIPFSFGLWISDASEAGLVVFIEQGMSGILLNDTDDATEWARNQYQHVKQNANPFFLRGGIKSDIK